MNTLTILHRTMKWRFHNSLTIVITILQPILWLVFYSSIAGQTMQGTGIENYTAFLLPGLLVLVSFSVCSSCGIMNYLMKSEGSFFRVLISPVSRSSILFGQLLEAVLCTFLEAAIMTAISFLFSVKISVGILGMLLIFIFIFLTAFFMAGLCYGISLILPNEVVYETVMNAIVLPIFFLSSALFPVAGIKGSLAIVIQLNPFTHMISALRSLILGDKIESSFLIFVLALFIALCSLSFLWALHRLKKCSKN